MRYGCGWEHCGNEIFAIIPKICPGHFKNVVILAVFRLNNHSHAFHVCLYMQLLCPAVNIYKQKIIQQKVFNKIIFVKAFLISYQQALDLKRHHLANRIYILTRSSCDQNVFQLLLVKNLSKDNNVLEMARANFGNNSKDFITAVDENNVIVVKDLSEGEAGKEIEKAAKAMESVLAREGMQGIRISYGTIVNELKDVSRSYKEAKMALDVGKIFFDERNIIAYSELGIGRLIYQLPIPLCKMFIKEIFGGKSPDDFDEETLTTINKFFENSLNVSETSRQLFIHRNTLVYRLDKLQKSTGLDLRVFEDAITFKIALMVVKYMKYMETFEY